MNALTASLLTFFVIYLVYLGFRDEWWVPFLLVGLMVFFLFAVIGLGLFYQWLGLL